ncbi:MAG: histidine--tRNA ligase [Puniceicoccales bacterium]|jgi:histidyl-tRNA synthetase|nr:histidine--tRNA ligase [Puniceicoccales bacterium]
MHRALPGFREFYPADCALRNHIFATFRRVVRRFGFEEFDGPTLEPLELFTEKSGQEIASQLFHFEDRGGRAVALRPEMTPTLARMVGARAAGLKRPMRWSNVGEAFRYERPQKGRLRSFYQMNADLLGVEGAAADGELLLLLLSVLSEFGLTAEDFHVRIGDRCLWNLFLSQFSLDGVEPVLAAIDRMEREEGTRERLLALAPADGAAIWDGISVLRTCHGLDGLRQFFGQFAPLRERAEQRLADWEGLLECVAGAGFSPNVSVDLTVVRGLAYYTGFVFEAFERGGEGRALAGGGRYDDLVSKLAGTPLPAVGFAIGDVTLANLLVEKQLVPVYHPRPAVFVLWEGDRHREGLALVTELRRHGLAVLWDLSPVSRSLSKQMQRADRSGAIFSLFAAADGNGPVTLRHMESGEEEKMDRAAAISRLVECHRRPGFTGPDLRQDP